jgi:hypothetical protein
LSSSVSVPVPGDASDRRRLRCGSITAIALGLIVGLQSLPAWAPARPDAGAASAPSFPWAETIGDAAVLCGFCLCLDLSCSLPKGRWCAAMLAGSVAWHLLIGRLVKLDWSAAIDQLPDISAAARRLTALGDAERMTEDFSALNLLALAAVVPPLLLWSRLPPWSFPRIPSRHSHAPWQWSVLGWLELTALMGIAWFLLGRVPRELYGFFAWTLPAIGLVASSYLVLRSTWHGEWLKRLVGGLLVFSTAIALPPAIPGYGAGFTLLLLVVDGLTLLALYAGTLDARLAGSSPVDA